MEQGVEQILAAYRRFQEAGRTPPVRRRQLADGNIVELCSTNGADWTLSLVRQPEGTLTPLTFGDEAWVSERYPAIMERWDSADWPPLTVVVDGATRVFQPAGMSLLFGVIRVGQAALLLGVIKRPGSEPGALALLHVSGMRITVVHVGAPQDLRRVDVDQQLRLQGVELEARTYDGSAAFRTMLVPAFARLLIRCSAPSRQAGPRHRGKGAVALLVWIFVQLVRRGAGDLHGRLVDIERQIMALMPELAGLDLPREVLGESVRLMLRIRTCLVIRERLKYRVLLSALKNEESAIYKKFCAESPTILIDADAAARLCGLDSPPPARVKHPRRCSTAAPGAPSASKLEHTPGRPEEDRPGVEEMPEVLKFGGSGSGPATSSEAR